MTLCILERNKILRQNSQGVCGNRTTPEKSCDLLVGIKTVSIAPAAEAKDALLFGPMLCASPSVMIRIKLKGRELNGTACFPRHFIHSLRLIFPRDHSNEFKCAAEQIFFPLEQEADGCTRVREKFSGGRFTRNSLHLMVRDIK